jgi:hypothetical protein
VFAIQEIYSTAALFFFAEFEGRLEVVREKLEANLGHYLNE